MYLIRKIVFFILVTCLLLACFNNGQSKNKVDKINNTKNDSITTAILKKFSLPYTESLSFDSNGLLFYCSKNLDTSSLIQIKENKQKVYVTYYTVLPEYHKYLNDYGYSDNELIFFEGCSFIIDTRNWQNIKKQALLIMADTLHPQKEEIHLDGETFALYYNNKSKYGNNSNSTIFNAFNNYLKGSILKDYAKLRKPRIYKAVR